MPDDRKPKFFYGYVIALAGFFTTAVAYGALYSFGVFFKPLISEFGWTRAATSGAYSLFMFLHGLSSIVAGRLNDRFGPRLVLTACGLFLGLGYLLMSQISTIWQLYLFYGVLVSIGMSGTVPLVSIVVRWFAKRRGLMTGIVVSGIGAGTVIMPPVASRLISSYGWSASYIIIGFVALVVVVIAAQFLRRDPSQLGLVPYGADEVKAESSEPGGRGFFLGEAIRTRQFWILSAAYFFAIFCQQTIMVHIVPHATELGISAILAANILAIIGGLSIAGRLGMGSAGDRIGSKPALVIALVLISGALFWLLVARDVWMLYLFAAIFGFGYGAMIVSQSPIVAELFGLRAHGAILGVVVFSATTGGAIGPLVAGHIFDITGSYQPVFLIYAVVSIMSLILASLLRPTLSQGGTNGQRRSP